MRLASILAITAATALAAQQRCEAPGGAFGVTSIQCTNCLMQVKGDTVKWLFQSEPVVISVDEGPLIIVDGKVQQAGYKPLLRAGDVVEAINNKPITTSAGSHEFNFPPRGDSRIAVRRGNARETLTAPPRDCGRVAIRNDQARTDSIVQVRRDSAIAAMASRAIASSMPAPKATATRVKLLAADMTPREGEVFIESEQFGFVVACYPRCNKGIPNNAPAYYWASMPPRIVAIAEDSPLKAVGVRVGDTIIEVNGEPVSEAGARAWKELSWMDVVPKGIRLKIRLQSGATEVFDVTPGRRLNPD